MSATMSADVDGGRAPDQLRSPALPALFVAAFVGILLMQLAWIVTLPAFGGMDEFDHAFRAASVAEGHVLAGPEAPHGRGREVVVPADLAHAASRICASYPYTGRDNCHPIADLGGGLVTIASAASSYNPAFYAVIGTAAAPFHGADWDFAARVTTAVLASLLLAWAFVVTRRRTTATWPLLALVIVTTPTLVYSSAVASPNGVTYAAGALVWSALVTCATSDDRPPVWALAVGSVTMLLAHSTSLVWLPVIAVAVLLLRPLAEWLTWVRRHRRSVLPAAVVVLLTALGCAAWDLMQHTDSPEVDSSVARSVHPSLVSMLGQWMLWCFQSIAAFPMRDQPAPLIVYPLVLVPFGLLLVLGWRAAEKRVRLAMALVAVCWLLIPTIASYRTFSSLGFAWQGRYSLPLAIGLPVLAAWAVTARGRDVGRGTMLSILVSCTLAQTISVGAVAAKGQRVAFAQTLLTGAPGVTLAVLLTLTGGAVVSVALLRADRHARPAGVGRPEPAVTHPY